MSRELTDDMKAQLQADSLNPFYAVELAFAELTVRYWTGFGDIQIDGETFAGIGKIMSIKLADETTELVATGANVVLQGLAAEDASLALSSTYQNRSMKIWFGVIDSGTVVDSPYLIFEGNMDTMSIMTNGDTGTLTITGENDLIGLNRNAARYYTDVDQKLAYPYDNGLAYTRSLANRNIVWGKGSG